MQPDSQSDAVGEAEFTPQNSYLLFVICSGFFLSYADRQILSVLLTPIKNEFHLSDLQLGAMSGLGFGVCYGLLSLPLARLADRGNRKTLLGICLALWSAATMACGLAASAFQLLILRMTVAVGEAGGTPASISILSDIFARKRGVAIACYTASGSLGGAMVAIIGAWLANDYGWRWAFVAVGAPGILLTLLVLLTIKEPERENSPTSIKAAAAEDGSFFKVAGKILRNRALLFCMLGGGASSAAISIVTWLPSFLQRSHHLSLAEAGAAVGLGLLLPGPLGELSGGFLNDWGERRNRSAVLKGLAIISLASIPIGFALIFVGSIPAVVGLIALWKLTGTIFIPATWAMSQSLVEPRQRATSQALTGMASNLIGYGLGPALTGLLSEMFRPSYGENSLSWAILASVAIFAAIAAMTYYASARLVARAAR